uniref:Peroxisomal membrane protein PEX14-like KPWE domain-containing protein n=1 Tax=Ornithorhynchus anatinus TaxID=9258 RepID=A0A6I8N773_ORNAN
METVSLTRDNLITPYLPQRLEQCSPRGAPAALPFSEMVRLVQRGGALPGLEQRSVVETCQQPTASRLPRRPKPWEPHAPSLSTHTVHSSTAPGKEPGLRNQRSWVPSPAPPPVSWVTLDKSLHFSVPQ